MICSDISKLLYVISWAVRRVKFETILKYITSGIYAKYHVSTNHAINNINSQNIDRKDRTIWISVKVPPIQLEAHQKARFEV